MKRGLVLAALVVGAVALRWSLFDVTSGDYRAFLLPWYEHLAESGGFAGLADEFSNYNTPYLVLLAGLTYLPIPPLVGIKAISVVFDLLLAFFAYRIVRQVRRDAYWLPTIIAGAVLLLPTVVLNSAAWGQCDSIYAALCLGSISMLIDRRPWLAAVFFGVAFAFKLQAVFLLPVLVAVLIINRLRISSLLAVPVAFLAALVPALVAGRSLASQLAVYPAQISGDSSFTGGGDPARPRGGGPGAGSDGPPPGGFGGGGGPHGGGSGGGGDGGADAVGTGHAFTYNAPTPYAWLPSDAGEIWLYAGLAVAALVGVAFGIWLLLRRRSLSGGEILLVAATSTLVLPLLLPQMHERYFYLAEVLLVLAIAMDKRMIIPALGIQAASVITYASYLTGRNVLPLEWTAVIATAAALAAAIILVLHLRRRPLALTDPARLPAA